MTREPTPLGDKICKRCTLDTPCVHLEAVCSSETQLWEVFWCVRCGKSGMVNTSVDFRHVDVYDFDPESDVARYWSRFWMGPDGGRWDE